MRAALCAVFFALAAAAAAQNPDDPKPPAGAVVGASVPAPVRAFVAFDRRYPDLPGTVVAGKKGKPERDPRNRTGMMHDLVTEHGLNPVVAVFTRETPEAEAAAARLVKLLDPLILKQRANNLGAFVAFLRLNKEYPLDEDPVDVADPTKLVREKEADDIRALGEALKTTRVPMGLAAKESAATAAWGLKPTDVMTVVLYHRMKVVARWDFPEGMPPDDAKLQEIAAAADREATPK